MQDFIPVVDSVTQKVIHIDFPPEYKKSAAGAGTFSSAGLDVHLTAPHTTPPALADDALQAAGRARIPPPLGRGDFLPDLIAENLQQAGKAFKPRDDLKPLHVVQPEGVSFKINGNELEWQKWKMHICKSSPAKTRHLITDLDALRRSVPPSRGCGHLDCHI